MDFRFKYRREKAVPEEAAREAREARDQTLAARRLAIGLSIPAALVSGPLVGWAIGQWLDARFGTALWMPLCILLGLVGSLKMVVDQLLRLEGGGGKGHG